MSEGELLIGIATLARAGATVGLVLEARSARTKASDSEQRRLLRSALAEQLDNLRRWRGANPAHGQPALERIRHAEVRLDAADRLLDQADLSADLAVYLVWVIGRIRDEGNEWRVAMGVKASSDVSTAPASAEHVRALWDRMVDRLQVLAALTSAEARRRRFDEIAAVHDAAPWVTVLEGPPGERVMRSVTDRTYLGAPRLPADPAFASVRPEARDAAGAATGARQKADLHEAASQSVGRLLGR